MAEYDDTDDFARNWAVSTSNHDVKVSDRPHESQVVACFSDMQISKVRRLMDSMGQTSLLGAAHTDDILEVIARRVATHTRAINTGYKVNKDNFEIAFKYSPVKQTGATLARDIREYLSLSCFGLKVQQPDVTRG